MIEIVYQDKQDVVPEEEGYFHVPKNIRQIGDSPTGRKIYIEDYVNTHLNRMVEESLGVGRMAILLGECHWINGTAYYFIRSSFQVEGVEVSVQNIPFDDHVWGAIYSTVKEHFSGQEIIGWFLSVPDFQLEINNPIYHAHLEHFIGDDKVFFAMDSVEKEEKLYIYDGTQMEEQKGYYIYYEKNDPMQAYLIARKEQSKEEKLEEIEDKAVKDFRKIINRKTDNKQPKSFNPVTAVAGFCLAGIVVVGGIAFIKNNEKMRSMEELISNLQGNESQSVISVEEDVKELEKTLPLEKPKEDANTHDQEESGQAVDKAEGQTDALGENKEKSTPEGSDSTTVATLGGGKRYMVKIGDTLSGISKTYYGTILKVSDICKANNLVSEDVIYPGQIIVLP